MSLQGSDCQNSYKGSNPREGFFPSPVILPQWDTETPSEPRGVQPGKAVLTEVSSSSRKIKLQFLGFLKQKQQDASF